MKGRSKEQVDFSPSPPHSPRPTALSFASPSLETCLCQSPQPGWELARDWPRKGHRPWREVYVTASKTLRNGGIKVRYVCTKFTGIPSPPFTPAQSLPLLNRSRVTGRWEIFSFRIFRPRNNTLAWNSRTWDFLSSTSGALTKNCLDRTATFYLNENVSRVGKWKKSLPEGLESLFLSFYVRFPGTISTRIHNDPGMEKKKILFAHTRANSYEQHGRSFPSTPERVATIIITSFKSRGRDSYNPRSLAPFFKEIRSPMWEKMIIHCLSTRGAVPGYARIPRLQTRHVTLLLRDNSLWLLLFR